MLGSFVEARIQAKFIPDVIRLSRDYLRKDETVWVMEKDSLRIQDVNVVFRDQQFAYISEGLSERDSIVKTNLTTVVEGAPLRTEGKTNAGTDGERNR
jgi:hypothetical protein